MSHAHFVQLTQPVEQLKSNRVNSARSKAPIGALANQGLYVSVKSLEDIIKFNNTYD